jgi:ribosome biogenesis protein UTP30
MVAMTKTSKRSSTKPSTKVTTEKKKAPERVDQGLLKKAVAALLKHHEETTAAATSEKEQLLGTDTSIQVQFGLEVAPVRSSPKPMRIEIPNSIFNVSADEPNYQLDEPEVCIIVKEDAKPWVQELIAQFPEQMGFIKKVMGLESLRKKHSKYSQRRTLLKKYSVFMADDRILPMLTSALGKDFFKAKKQPIPVNLTRKTSLPFNIIKALSSTYMTLPAGTCVMVRAGYTHMTRDALVENILAILERGVPKIPRQWSNLRSIAIKTPTSTSLPFYNKTPAELAAIAALAGHAPVWTQVDDDDGKMESSKTEKVDDKRKRKDLTSPLLKALKKQKQLESEASQASTKVVVDKDDDDNKTSKSPKSVTKTPPKRTTRSSSSQASSDVAKSSTKKKKVTETPPSAKEPVQTSSSTKKRRKSDSQVETPKEVTKESSTKSKAKKPSEKDAADSKLAKKEDSPAKKQKSDFVASKKFTGSKEGYAFRTGAKGLGYYIDVKPVPDKAALAALKRMPASKGDRRQSSGGGKQKNVRKGRRSF